MISARSKTLLTAALLVALSAAGPGRPASAADADASFLAQVEDLPLAPGLAEGDGGFTFDKPDGRIVEAYASGRVTGAEVMSFYREALPQLGWREVPARPGAVFLRGAERLTIETAQQAAGRLVVHFVLAPETGPAGRPVD